MFKKLINYIKNLFADETIIIKPCEKWSDLGDWNDFENIGRTIDVKKDLK